MRTLEPAKRTEPYVAGVNKSFPKETFDSILMPGDISLSGQFQPRIALNKGDIAEAHLEKPHRSDFSQLLCYEMDVCLAWTAKIMPPK